MPALPLRFHVLGPWSPVQLSVERVSSTRSEPPEVRRLIEAAWDEATARLGRHLFDGPMCRLESWDASAGHLTLRLAQTSYKTFLGTNLTHPDLADRFGRGVLANPVGVSPALLTADGFLMMGRRNDTVAYYPGRIHPFAGSLDPADASPFAAVRRELFEELSLAEADVSEILCTGIAEDAGLRQPEMIFLARTGRTRGEIEAALDPAEHRGTWTAPADEAGVRRAIAGARFGPGGFTPVAVASLLLYARVAFGGGVFDELAGAFGAVG